MALFYWQDSHVSRFCDTSKLQITFTVTWIKCLNHWHWKKMRTLIKLFRWIISWTHWETDILSYKPIFKHFYKLVYKLVFYKLVYTYFYCWYLCETTAAAQKNWAVFYICLISFGVTVLKVLYFWCSLCRVIGNVRIFNCSR